MINFFLCVVFGWAINASLSCAANALNCTRDPENTFDFIKLTFLPYVLMNLKEIRYGTGTLGNIKVLIVGHARHGKDTVAEYFEEIFGLSFESSSMAAARIFIYNHLKEKYGYLSFEECFLDRVNHRAEWHDLICEYNKEDKARLAKGILKSSDCYVGMRSNDEVQKCISDNLFDIVIWVDASNRRELEDKSSFNIDRSVADIIIDNNGSREELENKLNRIGKILFNVEKP